MNILFSLLITLPLSLSAISQSELSELINNAQEKYLYCDKNHSNMAEVVAEINTLDNDKNSPTWRLHEHIKRGYDIGKQDAIMEALEHAEEILQKHCKSLSPEQIEQLHVNLSSVIDAVTHGKLTVDVQSVLDTHMRTIDQHHNEQDESISRKHHHPKIKKIKKILHALEKAKFFKKVEFKHRATFDHSVTFKHDVTFEDNVTIAGDLAVTGDFEIANQTVDCNLTVGCNISMNDSVSSAVGNILKNGEPFIHNFGLGNTFVGVEAGNFTLTGQSNTGFGEFALTSLTSGFFNDASGIVSLASNTTGEVNTAHGALSLASNTSGNGNTAVGFVALASNTTGSGNTAIGIESLASNTTGESNTAIGAGALSANITGSSNIALGENAGENLISGNDNIYIGNEGGTSAETGFIRIGTSPTHIETYIQGIFNNSVGVSGLNVEVDSTGKLGTMVSSHQFKRNIAEMGIDSEKIYDLNPVTFSYKNDVDNNKHYGLIAEEVAEIFPSLVVYDAEGNPLAVRYQVLPMLLLNEMQKQQACIQDLAERVAYLEAAAAA